MGLYPPSEAVPTACAPPTDSPLTPFDEAALFHAGETTPTTISRPTWPAASPPSTPSSRSTLTTSPQRRRRRLRRRLRRAHHGQPARPRGSAWRSSVVYVPFDAFPDLALMLDAPVFFFRRARRRRASVGPTRAGGAARARPRVVPRRRLLEPTTWTRRKRSRGSLPGTAVARASRATTRLTTAPGDDGALRLAPPRLAAQDRGGRDDLLRKGGAGAVRVAPLFGDNTNATLRFRSAASSRVRCDGANRLMILVLVCGVDYNAGVACV